MHRFYISPERWQRDWLALDADEAHHALHVLRMKPGDRAVVFNGRGDEATVELGEAEGERLPVRARQFGRTEAVPCQITLAQAIPKGKTMELIIQKATELGATSVVPLLSERSVVQLDQEEAPAKQEKWQRTALEACKQCGRNWLPTVARPQSVRNFLETHGKDFDLALVASLQPDAGLLQEHLRFYRETTQKEKPTRVLVMVGPEGDFTPAEIGQARSAGCFPLTLGPIVLRSETAAIYCLSVLAYELF